MGRSRYCEAHADRSDTRQRWKRWERRTGWREDAPTYGWRWSKVRDAYARKHPLCEDCRDVGRTRELDVVDHVVPLSEGGTHDWDNLRSRCHHHHARKTQRDIRRRQRAGGGSE